MRQRRGALPSELEIKSEPPLQPKAKEVERPEPATLQEYLERYGFKNTYTYQDWTMGSRWVLPSPIGIAVQLGYHNIVKEFLENKEFIDYLDKTPEEVGYIIEGLFKMYGGDASRRLIMKAISKLVHTQPSQRIMEDFSKNLARLNNYRDHKEALIYYLEYCNINLGEFLPTLFDEPLDREQYSSKENVIDKFPLQAAFDSPDLFLLQLFLSYHAKPDVDFIQSILAAEAALPENTKKSKLAYLYLWLENNFEENLPILVEAVGKTNIIRKRWMEPFFQLPKEHFDKFAAAFNLTNEYDLQSRVLTFKAGPAQLSEKLFGQIHNDRALRGTLLEGMYPWETMGYLAKTINATLYDPKTPEHYRKNLEVLHKKITGALDIAENLRLFYTKTSIEEGAYHEKIEFLTDTILKKLQENNEVLFPGGWINASSPGHSMLYEIKDSKPPGKKVLLIYNTGDGIHDHFKRMENKKIYTSSVKAYEFEIGDFSQNRNRLAAVIRPLMGFMLEAGYNKSAKGLDGKELYRLIKDITGRQGLQESKS